MRVTFPMALVGLTMSRRVTSSEEVVVGPTLMPMGFSMPRKYSTWAPFGWRVRSPIQRKWAEVLYQPLPSFAGSVWLLGWVSEGTGAGRNEG